MRYINDFREGDNITGIYLCRQKNSAITKNGKEYENLTLADKTGSLSCKIWEPNSMGIGDFSVNDYVEIHGRVSVFNGALQMSIDRAFKAAEGTYDPADYLPVSPKDPAQMASSLNRYINSVQTPYFRLLLESIFIEDVQFREAFLFGCDIPLRKVSTTGLSAVFSSTPLRSATSANSTPSGIRT